MLFFYLNTISDNKDASTEGTIVFTSKLSLETSEFVKTDYAIFLIRYCTFCLRETLACLSVTRSYYLLVVAEIQIPDV